MYPVRMGLHNIKFWKMMAFIRNRLHVIESIGIYERTKINSPYFVGGLQCLLGAIIGTVADYVKIVVSVATKYPRLDCKLVMKKMREGGKIRVVLLVRTASIDVMQRGTIRARVK